MFFLKELPSRHTLERYHDRFPSMDVAAVDEALHIMKKGSLLIRAIDEYFAGHGLSQLRYLILVVLDREPDRDQMTVTELVSNLDVSKPVMTRTLKSLVEEGYIAISVNEDDRREKLVKLLPRAERQLRTVLPGYYETIQKIMKQLETENG